MSRRAASQLGPDDSGHDSFLDIVANLVGILVILIMVVGVRARHARTEVALTEESPPSSQIEDAGAEPVETVTDEPSDSDNPTTDNAVESLRMATNEAASLFVDTHELEAKTAELAEFQMIQEAQRNQLQLIVSAAEKQLQVRQASLAEADQKKLQMASLISTTEKELEDIQRQADSISAETQPPTELAHYPTPLAQTVFGREEHFRLLGGRLTYVPLNRLVEQLQSDAKSKLWKMEKADQITEMIGPIDGFRLRYTMQRVERRVMTPSGPATARAIELDRFELVPVSDLLGDSVPAALVDGSPFRQFVESLDPRETTVTIWTYPDSFAEFRQVRDLLRDRGFLTAARPLPNDRLIGGSPDGNKSLAQ